MLDFVSVDELQFTHKFLAKLYYLYLHFLPYLPDFCLKHLKNLLGTHLIPHSHQHLPDVPALNLLHISLPHIVDKGDL